MEFSEISDIKHIFELHQIMQRENIVMVYEGNFSQEITNNLLSMTEKKMNIAGEETPIKRKIFNVMVECLQNICKHANIEQENQDYHSAIFMIGKDENDYFIYTGNAVNNESKEFLYNKINTINNLDADGLANLYREVFRKGTISEKGGAGLGLIDMARKSGNKLSYDFTYLDSNYWFYTLRINIARKTNNF